MQQTTAMLDTAQHKVYTYAKLVFSGVKISANEGIVLLTYQPGSSIHRQLVGSGCGTCVTQIPSCLNKAFDLFFCCFFDVNLEGDDAG